MIYEYGPRPELGDSALPHWDLIEKYDIIDFELGNKISGAGFPVYKGKGARLQRALINFFIDEAVAAGYTEVQPPLVVNETSGYATGQLPDKEGQMYALAEGSLYLIPTAEVSDHQYLPRRNFKARRTTGAQRRLYRLLSARSRLVGCRCAGTQSFAPI